jgi:glucose/mannose transport system substrate-binding protein
MPSILCRSCVLCGSLLLGSLGCSSSSSSDSAGAGGQTQALAPVQLYTWWIAPGEAQALQGLIDAYKTTYPMGSVDDSGEKSGADSRANLDTAFTSGLFPDVFQLNTQDLGPFMTAHPNQVESVDSLFSDTAVNAAFLPDVLKAVTIDGHIQAVPIDVPRESAFFYNMTLFSANNLTPPTTVPDLLKVCASLQSAGVTPIALATGSNNGWIVRELFMGVLQGTMGSAVFKDFITATKPVTDPEITQPLQDAIATLGTILTQYINADSASTLSNGNTFGWTDAADAVQAGKAAMFIHGDWVKGYWTALGWTPGVDFGETGAPGAADLFSYGIDVLGMPSSPPHPTSAMDFLTVATSAGGQVAFARSKGSSPARTDVGDQLDVLGKATLSDLVTANVRVPVVAPSTWDTALGVFSSSACATSDQDALYQAFVANPPPAMSL